MLAPDGSVRVHSHMWHSPTVIPMHVPAPTMPLFFPDTPRRERNKQIRTNLVEGRSSFKAWFFQVGWLGLPFFPRGHRHNPSKKDQHNPRAPSPGVRIVAFLIPKPVYMSYYAIEVQNAADHLYHYIHRCEHKITTHSTMVAVCTAGKVPY